MTRHFATVCLFAAVTVRASGLGDDFDILYALLLAIYFMLSALYEQRERAIAKERGDGQ